MPLLYIMSAIYNKKKDELLNTTPWNILLADHVTKEMIALRFVKYLEYSKVH